MLATPFLTEIDPQAAVKGSRDPLGIQPIWSRLGRHIIGNLTTVTTSVRDFTTLILGYYFVEGLADRGLDGDELHAFLRWEQLAAHARFRVHGDTRIRGIERVKKAKNEGGRLRISADATGQILSNQKTYGLWGLYTGPARASGLVEGEPTRLTSVGRDLVESVYLPAFTTSGLKNGDPVLSRLSKPRVDLDVEGADRSFLRSVGSVFSPHLGAKERSVFRESLLLGHSPDKTDGRQAVIATAIEQTLQDDAWFLTPGQVTRLAKMCRKGGIPGDMAATDLERIRVAEQLLAPSAALFDHVLASDGQTIDETASTVRKAWGAQMKTIDLPAISELEGELSGGEAEAGKRWLQLAAALGDGSYRTAVQLLIEQNAAVMKARAGAGAWVDLSGSELDVRYRDENLGGLPERNVLPLLWKHSYFIDSLREIAVALKN